MTLASKNRLDQLQQGQVPKGSKMTQLGIVPSDWDIVPIGDIGRIVTGSTPPTVIHDYYVGDRLFITPADFTEGIYVDNTSRTVSDSAYGVSRVIPPDSIYVVCIGATVGKTNMCRVAAICNQQINAIVPGNGFCNQFLYYCIDYFFNRTKARYVGSQTLPIVSKNLFSRVGLVLPTLAEQRKIAKILAAQDKVIELKEKRLAEKQRQKKYLMQQLLTGKKRLKGFNGEWINYRLNQITKRIKCKNEEANDNVLTISAQHGLINQTDFFNKEIASADKRNYYLLRRDDFAYNKSYSSGYPFGAIKRLTRYDVGIVSPLYICFQISAKEVSLEYIEQYFEAGLINREIQACAQEGARNHGLLNIAIDDFFNIKIVLPYYKEQLVIAKILKSKDSEIDLLRQDIEQEKRKKKALMQLLLTGIVRVNV
jgi:type I restriction enzyme S subunit